MFAKHFEDEKDDCIQNSNEITHRFHFRTKVLLKIPNTLPRNVGLTVFYSRQINISLLNYEGDHFSLLSLFRMTEGRFVHLLVHLLSCVLILISVHIWFPQNIALCV